MEEVAQWVKALYMNIARPGIGTQSRYEAPFDFWLGCRIIIYSD